MSDEQNPARDIRRDLNPASVSDREALTERQARAHLRQAIWELAQFLDLVDLREYIDMVLPEIEADDA